MATTIITKYGSGAPAASDVVRGELAVDTENKRLYTEDSGGSVVELGTNPTTLAVDTDTLVVDATNNRVGIGLTSPDTKLHLSDGGTPEFRLESTDTSVVSGQSLGDITWESNDVSGGGQGVRAKIHAEAENAGTIYGLVFSTGTGAAPTEKVRITNTGNVGIGTSPSSELHVKGADETQVYIEAPAGSNSGIRLLEDGTSKWTIGNDQSNDGLFFYDFTATAERLRIDASGNVGIGVSPGVALDINRATSTASYARVGNGENVQAYIGVAGDNLPVLGSFTNHALRFVVNTSEVARFDTSGNFGIGTQSPVSPLTTSIGAGAGGSLNNQISMTHSGASNSYHIKTIRATANDEPAGLAFVENTTERMRIDSSGNVGIGTDSPGVRLHVEGGTDSNVMVVNNIGTAPNYIFDVRDDGVSKCRVDPSGNLLLNETSVSGNAEKFRLTSGGTSSATAAALFNDSAGTELFFVRSDGAFRTGSAAASPYNNTAAVTANLFVNTDGTLVRATSSRRYKKDIVDARFGLSDLLNLRPVNYKGINSEVDEDIVYGGLIAEEVHDAGLTEFVEYNKENQPDALRYQHMVSLCIKAIQEQQDLIESLTARIAALEGAN